MWNREDFQNPKIDKVSLERTKQKLWNEIQAQAKPRTAWNFSYLNRFFATGMALLLIVLTATYIPGLNQANIAEADFELMLNTESLNKGEVSFTLTASEDFKVATMAEHFEVKNVEGKAVEYKITRIEKKTYQIELLEEKPVLASYTVNIKKEEPTELAMQWVFEEKAEVIEPSIATSILQPEETPSESEVPVIAFEPTVDAPTYFELRTVDLDALIAVAPEETFAMQESADISWSNEPEKETIYEVIVPEEISIVEPVKEEFSIAVDPVQIEETMEAKQADPMISANVPACTLPNLETLKTREPIYVNSSMTSTGSSQLFVVLNQAKLTLFGDYLEVFVTKGAQVTATGKGNLFWVRSSALVDGGGAGATYYLEPGAKVLNPGEGATFYLFNGATLSDYGQNPTIITCKEEFTVNGNL